jgi:hypothetical protein
LCCIHAVAYILLCGAVFVLFYFILFWSRMYLKYFWKQVNKKKREKGEAYLSGGLEACYAARSSS